MSVSNVLIDEVCTIIIRIDHDKSTSAPPSGLGVGEEAKAIVILRTHCKNEAILNALHLEMKEGLYEFHDVMLKRIPAEIAKAQGETP